MVTHGSYKRSGSPSLLLGKVNLTQEKERLSGNVVHLIPHQPQATQRHEGPKHRAKEALPCETTWAEGILFGL